MSAAEVKAWAVFSEDGRCLAISLTDEHDSWCLVTESIPFIGMPEAKRRYTCEPVTILRDGEVGVSLEWLQKAKRGHTYCEDPWYSCPKAEDGCADERQGSDCNCGADAWNAEIDALLATSKGQKHG